MILRFTQLSGRSDLLGSTADSELFIFRFTDNIPLTTAAVREAFPDVD